MVPGFDPSSFLVFRWDAEPKDGDIVFVKAIRRRRPEQIITRLIEWLYVRSLRMERLFDQLRLQPRYEPTDREYLVRRFHAEGKPNLNDGAGFRLETLDGRGEVIRHTPLVDVFVSGVLTEHRPWGVHRELAVC